MNKAAFLTIFEREPDKVWSPKELAAKLDVCDDVIYGAIRDGSLPAYRAGKCIIIYSGHVDEWLKHSITRSAEGKIAKTA